MGDELKGSTFESEKKGKSLTERKGGLRSQRAPIVEMESLSDREKRGED